jgi:hypothetical protein
LSGLRAGRVIQEHEVVRPGISHDDAMGDSYPVEIDDLHFEPPFRFAKNSSIISRAALAMLVSRRAASNRNSLWMPAGNSSLTGFNSCPVAFTILPSFDRFRGIHFPSNGHASH